MRRRKPPTSNRNIISYFLSYNEEIHLLPKDATELAEEVRLEDQKWNFMKGLRMTTIHFVARCSKWNIV